MSIYEVLKTTNLPCVYSHFTSEEGKSVVPPYIAYIGSGQNVFRADDTHYWSENTYQVEYYYKLKDESNEAVIEKALLDNGFQFEKSEDVFIEDQNIFLIYYYVN